MTELPRIPRKVVFGLSNRARLLLGAKKLARAVAVTHGPAGRTVALARQNGLLSTKDGVSVAREITLEDPVENLGAQILKNACIKVGDTMGDGTTSVAVLASALLEVCHKQVVGGISPLEIAKSLQEASIAACDIVRDLSIKIASRALLERVAFLASNGDDEIARPLAEACLAIGKDGTITIENGHSTEIDLELKNGMEIARGVAHLDFLRDATERVVEGALVAVVGAKLQSMEDVRELMESASQWPQNQLVIFVEDIHGEALTTMVLNDAKDTVKCCAIRAPGYGPGKQEHLKDIAALCNAQYIDPVAGMDFRKAFNSEWFGSLRKLTVKTQSSVLEGYEDAEQVISTRLRELDHALTHASSEYDKDRLRERAAKLAGGLCILRIGGATELEIKERRGRVEDALGSVRAALRSGVVPGGGAAYLTASEGLLFDPPSIGWHVLGEALKEPFASLVRNAGLEPAILLEQVGRARDENNDDWIGWEALTDSIRNLYDDPAILDPLDVVVAVIQTAVSSVAVLLTAEVSITRSRR